MPGPPISMLVRVESPNSFFDLRGCDDCIIIFMPARSNHSFKHDQLFALVPRIEYFSTDWSHLLIRMIGMSCLMR